MRIGALGRRVEADEATPNAESSIVTLLDSIIYEAHEARASDIHFDPRADAMTVRLRVDGLLHDTRRLPSSAQAETIARIKVLAGLRTDEHHAAQDGRFDARLPDGTVIDVRVSVCPTYYGENAVLRLLGVQHHASTLDGLGMSSAACALVHSALERPHGLVLVTGATGSGKTTTLYTLLQLISKPDISVITLEDPIEYSLAGVNQIPINHRAGLTFGNGLRSVLRQDPDVIMVGEIRDRETATLAVNTALTGHLVLSTLHTNDAASTLPRLLDMGVEPYLIASTVSLVISQRLVRRLCDMCKVVHTLSDAELASLPEECRMPDGVRQVWVRKGCEACGHNGYRGRVGIFEVMEITPSVREGILRTASADLIHRIALDEEMTSLVADGMSKVREGVTTIEEVLRVRRV